MLFAWVMLHECNDLKNKNMLKNTQTILWQQTQVTYFEWKNFYRYNLYTLMVTLWKDVNFTNLYLPFTKWIEFFIPLVCFSFFLPFFLHHHAFSFWWEDFGFLVFSAVLRQFFLYFPIHLGFLLKNAGKIPFHI